MSGQPLIQKSEEVKGHEFALSLAHAYAHFFLHLHHTKATFMIMEQSLKPVFQARRPKILWFLLLKCEDYLFFSVL